MGEVLPRPGLEKKKIVGMVLEQNRRFSRNKKKGYNRLNKEKV